MSVARVVERVNTLSRLGFRSTIVLMIIITRKLQFSDNAALKFEVCVLNTTMDSRVVALSLYHINCPKSVPRYDIAYPVL